MPPASGMRESFVMGRETSFKTPPGSPAGSLIPSYGPAMGLDRNKFQSDALDGDANPNAVIPGKKWVGIDTGKVDCSPIALMDTWRSLFGAQDTTGTSALQQHLFYLKDQESWFFEQRHTDLGKFPRFLGGYIGNGAHNLAPEGIMTAQFTGLAARQVNPTPSSTIVTGTLTDRTTLLPFSYLFAFIRRNGTKVGYAKVFNFAVNRQIDKDFSMDETDEVAVIFGKKATISGTIEARFENADLLDDSNSAIECSLDFRVPAGLGSAALGFFPKCLLTPFKVVTNGTGLCTVTGGFDAYKQGATFSGQTRSRYWVSDGALPTLTFKIKTDVTPAGATFTAGSSDLTPDLLATGINAVSGLTGIASVERLPGETGGVLVLTAPTAGAAGYVQVDATSTGAIEAGFDTVQHSGLDGKAIVCMLLNKVAA